MVKVSRLSDREGTVSIPREKTPSTKMFLESEGNSVNTQHPKTFPNKIKKKNTFNKDFEGQTKCIQHHLLLHPNKLLVQLKHSIARHLIILRKSVEFL